MQITTPAAKISRLQFNTEHHHKYISIYTLTTPYKRALLRESYNSIRAVTRRIHTQKQGKTMYTVLINLLTFAGIFVLVIGIMTVFSWALPIKSPADNSNRINRVRLWWFAISAPHRFLKCFPWMGGDEVDNLRAGRTWEKGEKNRIPSHDLEDPIDQTTNTSDPQH